MPGASLINYQPEGIRKGVLFLWRETQLEYMAIVTNATNTIIDLSDIQFSHLYWVFLLPAICAAADIITGWLQATINSCWDSTKMRKGLYRKGGEMLVVFLAYIIYLALQIPVEIINGIVIYIVIMEIVSVIENLDLAGVPMPTWITHRLKKIADGLVREDKEDEA
jgi:toxin secretion/phage lysis holin